MIFRSANYKTLKRVLLQSTLFGVIFTTVLFGVGGVAGFGKVFAASDCDSNAVIYCGVSTVGEVQSKYASGDGRNSATSIQRIFSGFSISSADIQAMNSTAKNGSISRNGNVYFGDKLVATGAVTAGRQDMPGSTKHNNQGTVYYKRPPSVSFASSPLDAYVMMKDGVFQFAIIKSCGNPVNATPKTTPPPTPPPPAPQPQPQPQPQPTPQPTPTPTPPPAKPEQPAMCSGNTTNSNSNGIASQGGNCSINTTTVVQQIQQTPPPAPPQTPAPSGQCTNLNVTAASGSATAMTVNAAVTYATQNGATLQNITYDFGDNVTIPPTTATNMSHTYQQSGSYTITATLTFSGASGTPTTTTVSTSTAANNTNNSNSAIPASVCQASITVAPAPTPPTPQPTPTPTPTPPPAAPATVTPAGATTTTPTQTTEVPSKLVATGVGGVAGLFGITTIVSGLAYSYFIRRRLGEF